MTGLPLPRKKKSKSKKKKRKGAKKKAVADAAAAQDEIVTADEVTEEVVTLPTIVETAKRTNRVFSCLWKGEDLPGFCNNVYGPKYVECLNRGVRRHVPNGQLTMLCDEYYYQILKKDKRFNSVRLEKFAEPGVGGWSRIFEVNRENLRPKLGKRHVWVGLDTVFMGNCQWLFDWSYSPVGLPMDPFHPHVACNGVWTWDYEGAAFVWDEYQAAKASKMENYQLFGRPSEMMLLRYLFKAEGWVPLEDKPRKLLSYKRHVLFGYNPWKMQTSITYFHGNPKPHQLKRDNLMSAEWLKR